MRRLFALFVFALCAALLPAQQKSIYDFTLKSIDHQPVNLSSFTGKVVLIVNVASKCGYTPQYTALEALYEKYKDRGFVIVGVPANNFMQQEPGTDAEIKTFCTSKYEVSFPIFDKIHVKGTEQAPLYAALCGPGSKFPGDVKWNFGKFLIGRNGEVLARFEPGVKPDNPAIISAVVEALKAPPTAP